jgi:hypothetical protein
MKTRLRLLITTLLTVPALALSTTALVSAETGTGSSGSTDTTKTEDTVKPDDKQLLNRLTERKAEYKAKIAATELARLKEKCKLAQTGNVSSLHGRIKGIETSRNEVYNNLVSRLTKLDEKLKLKGVDTTKLEAEIATLKTKISTFQTDLAKYKQAVLDLKSMDCAADPTAFKASLESARTLREQVNKDAQDIKTYVNDTIKPTLKEIRAQLEAKEKETSNSTTGGTQ